MTLYKHPQAVLRMVAVASTTLGVMASLLMMPVWCACYEIPVLFLAPPLVLVLVALPANILCVWRHQIIGVVGLVLTILLLYLPAWFTL